VSLRYYNFSEVTAAIADGQDAEQTSILLLEVNQTILHFEIAECFQCLKD
jgi:hypothetical protein